MAFEDAFGRIVESIDGLNTTTSQVRDMLRTLMTGKVGKPTVMGKKEEPAEATKAEEAEDKEDLLPSFASIQKTLDTWHSSSIEDTAKLERIAAATEAIKTIMPSLQPNFNKEAGEAKQYADAAVQVHTQPASKEKKGGFSPEGIKLPVIKGADAPDMGLSKSMDKLIKMPDELKEQKKILDEVNSNTIIVRDKIKKLTDEATTKGTLYVTDLVTQGILNQILAASGGRAAANVAASAAAGSAGTGGTGGGTPAVPPAPSAPPDPGLSLKDQIKELHEIEELIKHESHLIEDGSNSAEKQLGFFSAGRYVLHKVRDTLQDIESSIMAAGEKGRSAMDMVFGGVIKDELKFYRDIRQTAFELQGVTGESKNLQKEWANIGKTVAATGVDRTAFQEAYIKTLKGGIRDLKQAHAVTVAQLNTEKQLGLAAGTLGEEFSSWSLAGRMTTMQIAEMGRGMREVARNTGLTGEHLAKAVKSSEDLVTTLRNAAQLTAASAKNIMEIVANAQKLGVTPQVNTLLKAMSSTAELLTKSSAETSGFLLIAATRAGRLKEMMEGTITRSKSGMKDLVKGMEGLLKSFGVESLEAIDQLPDEVKFRLNLNLKSSFGMELGEVRNVIQSFKEASKGLGDRLDDINKKRKENLTLEEKATLLEQERALKQSAALSMVTALDEAAKGAKDMDQALAKFGTRKKEFEGDLSAMGHAWTSNADAAKAAIEESLSNINTGLAKAGKAQIKISTKEIEEALKDPTKFRELGSKLSKADQELATAQKAQADPISKMQQGMMELNDTIRQYSSKALTALLGIMGSTGLIATLMANQFAKMYIELLYIRKSGMDMSGVPLIGGTLQKIFNPKAAAQQEKALVDAAAAQNRLTMLQEHHADKTGLLGGKPKPAPGTSTLPGTTNVPGTAPGTTSPAGGLGQHDLNVHDLRTHELLAEILKCVCMKGAPTAPSRPALSKPQQAEFTGGATAQREKVKEGLAKIKAPKGSEEYKEQARRLTQAAQAERFKAAATGDPKVGQELLARQEKYIKMQEKLQMKGPTSERALLLKENKLLKTKMAGAKDMPAKAGDVFNVGSNDIVSKAGSSIGKQVQALKSAAPDLLKGAVALALAAAAIIALAVVILKIGQTIARFANVDANKAIEIGKTVAAILASAGVIALAVIGSVKAIEALNKMELYSKKMAWDMFKGAATLALLTPAIIALAVIMLNMGKAIMKFGKMNKGEAIHTAKLVSEVMLGAGIVAIEIGIAAAALYGIGKLDSSVQGLVPMIYSGLKALALLMPAVMALFVMVWAFVKFISALWTVKKAQEATKLVTAAFTAMLITAVGIAAGAAILGGIGALVDATEGALVPIIWSGALALALIMPAVMALFWAVTKFVDFIAALWTIEKAKAAVKLVTNAFLAMSITALGIAAGGTILAALGGAFGGAVWEIVGFIWMGVGALLLMMPPIVVLFAIVTKFVKLIESLWTVESAKAAVKLVTAAFTAMALTALGIAAGGTILAALGGAFGGAIWEIIGFIWMGIGAILLMMPPILMLFKIVKGFIDFLSNMWTVEEAKKMTDLVKASFEAMLITALGIAAGGAALGGLGYLGWTAVYIVGMCWLGIAAIALMMPPIYALFNIIKGFIEFLEEMWTMEEAKAAAEMVKASFEALAITAIGIAVGGAMLAGFAYLGTTAVLIVALAWLGYWGISLIMPAIKALTEKIVEFIKFLAETWTVEDAKEAAQLVEASFDAIGMVVWGIIKAMPGLIVLGLLSVFGDWMSKLFSWGVESFKKMSDSYKDLATHIINFIKDLAGLWTLEDAQEGAKFIEATFDAVSTVTWAIIKSMPGLIVLGLLSSFGDWMAKLFQWGVDSFKKMATSYKDLVTHIVNFIKDLAGLWSLEDAQQGAKFIEATLDAVGIVAWAVIKAMPGLIILGLLSSFGDWMAKLFQWGVDSFKKMATSFKELVTHIIAFIKDIAGQWSLQDAQEASKFIEATLDAVGMVAWAVIKAIPGLVVLGLLSTFGDFISTLFKWGVDSFNKISDHFKELVTHIIAFIKDIAGRWSLQDVQEASKFIDATMTAVGAVASAVIKAAPGLMVLGLLSVFGDWIAKLCQWGVESFKKISGSVKELVVHIIDFIKELAGKWSLEDAATASDFVKATFKAVNAVVSSIIGTMPLLIILGVLSVFGKWLGSLCESGREAFDEIQESVSKLVYSIIDFIHDLASMWSLEDAQKSAEFIKATFKAVDVTVAAIIKQQKVMARLGMLTWFSRLFGINLTSGGEAIDQMIPPVKGFVRKIADFGKEISKFMGIEDAKDIAIMMQEIGKISIQLEKTIRTVIEKLVPLTKAGIFFKKAPIDKIKDVCDKMKEYFPKIVEFIKEGIVDPINANFDDVEDLQEVEGKLTAMAAMISKIPGLFNTLISSIVPVMKGGWFSKAPSEKLDAVKWEFFTFMWSTAQFISLGIVWPVNYYFGDVEDLNEVAGKLTAMAAMIGKIPGLFNALVNGIVPVMKGGWFSKAPSEKILAVKDEFREFMWTTAEFISEGIVWPVEYYFDDVDDINDVATTLTALASMIGKIPGMFDALVNGIVPVIKGGWFSKAPKDKINAAKDEFEAFMWSTSSFIWTGIIRPVQVYFDDPDEINDVEKSVSAMTSMITKLPPMFNALVQGLVPLFNGGWFRKAPAEKLNGEFRDNFRNFFWAIASWLNCGIVVPVMIYFGESKRLEETRKSVEAMSAVIQALPPIFDSLVNGLVPLFSGGWFRKAPAEKLNGEFRQKFSEFFWAIAHFLDEGIITPILEVLGNPKDMQIAAQSLKATGEMLKELPGVVEFTAKELPKLMRYGKKLHKLMVIGDDGKLYWSPFFRVLFNFLDQAVITPILSVLGNPRDMQIAAQALKATGDMLKELPDVVNYTIFQLPAIMRLGRRLGRLTVIGNDGQVYWNPFFIALFDFLDKAVITPILSILGNPRDMQIAAQSLKATGDMLKALPDVVNYTIRDIPKLMRLGKKLGKLIVIGDDGERYWNPFFINLFRFLDEAVITPILSILGNPRDMQIAAQSLKATAEMMQALPAVVWGTIWATEGLNECTGMLARLSGEVAGDAGVYKEFFTNLFKWLDTGIITPILRDLGHPQDMVMAAASLKATADLMKKLPWFLTELAKTTDQLWSWYGWKSPLARAGDSIKTFSDWFAGIANGLGRGIFYPIKTYFPKPEEVAMAADQLSSMIQVIKLLPKFIEELAVEMDNIRNLPWWKEKDAIRQKSVEFSDFFGAIAWGLGVGIIDPIRTKFPESSEFEEINARLDGVAKMLPKVRNVIDVLMAQITALGGKVGVYSKMLNTAWDVYNFAIFFINIANNIKYGMINPILTGFPTVKVFDEINGRLDSVAIMIPKVAAIIKLLMSNIKEFGTQFKTWGGVLDAYWDADRFFTFFKLIALSINRGILWPVWLYLSDTKTMKEINGRLEAVEEMIPLVGRVIDSLMDEIEWFGTSFDNWDQTLKSAWSIDDFAQFFKMIALSINQGILWPVWLYFSDTKTMKEIVSRLEAVDHMIPLVGTVIKNMAAEYANLEEAFETGADPGQAIGEFADFFKGVAQALKDGIIDPVNTLFPDSNELEGVVESLDSLNNVLGSLDKVVATLMGTLDRMQGVNLDLSPLLSLNVDDLRNLADIAEALSDIDIPELSLDGLQDLDLSQLSLDSNIDLSNIQGSLNGPDEADLIPNTVLNGPNTGLTPSIPAIRPPQTGGEPGLGRVRRGTATTQNGRITDTEGDFTPEEMQEEMGRHDARRRRAEEWKRNAGRRLGRGGLESSRSTVLDDEENLASPQPAPMSNTITPRPPEEQPGIIGAAQNPDDFGNIVKLFVKKIRQTYRIVDVSQKKENTLLQRAQAQDVPGTGAEQMTAGGTSGAAQLLGKQMIPGGENDTGQAERAAMQSTKRMNADVGQAGGLTATAPKKPEKTFSESALGGISAIGDSIGFDNLKDIDTSISQQKPQMTQFNAALLSVQDYLDHIEDLFQKCAKIIESFRKTAEYTEMFGKVGIYETMITQKIGEAKSFVPTIKRIAEAIGQGFDFSGGPELTELVTKQMQQIKQLQGGLTDTEKYTTEIAKIFTTAQTILEKIKTTTNSLEVIANLDQLKTEITEKVKAGNTLVGQIKEIARDYASTIDLSGIQDLTTEITAHMGELANVEEAVDLSDRFLTTVQNIATKAGRIQQTAQELGGRLRPPAPPAAPATPAPAAGTAPVAPATPAPAPGAAPAPAGAANMPTTQDLMAVLMQIKNILAPGAEEGSFYTHDTAMEDAIKDLQKALVYTNKTTSNFQTQSLVGATVSESEGQTSTINRAVTSSGQAATSAIESSGTMVKNEVEGIPGTVQTTVETANDTLSRSLTTELQGTRTALTQQINQIPQRTAPTTPNPPAQQGGNVATQSQRPAQQQQVAQGAEAMQNLAEQGLTRGSIYTHDENLANILEQKIVPRLAPIGEQASVEPRREIATPQSPVDVHNEMQQRYASQQPSAGNMPSPELAQIASLTATQVGLTKEMLDNIIKIATALAPSNVVSGNNGGNPVSTMTNPAPTVPARYFRLTAGLFNQGATTGVLGANV